MSNKLHLICRAIRAILSGSSFLVNVELSHGNLVIKGKHQFAADSSFCYVKIHDPGSGVDCQIGGSDD